jgi:hypothetical protein
MARFEEPIRRRQARTYSEQNRLASRICRGAGRLRCDLPSRTDEPGQEVRAQHLYEGPLTICLVLLLLHRRTVTPVSAWGDCRACGCCETVVRIGDSTISRGVKRFSEASEVVFHGCIDQTIDRQVAEPQGSWRRYHVTREAQCVDGAYSRP